MKITICSSVDFTPKIIELKKDLENLGHSVNIPYFTQMIFDGKMTYEQFMTAKENGSGDTLLREGVDVDFFKRYWDYIKNSDAILVLNENKKGVDGYIGGNTLMEMGFAYGFGKKILLLSSIPARSERMHYVDEIIDMKPIVLNGDLRNLGI